MSPLHYYEHLSNVTLLAPLLWYLYEESALCPSSQFTLLNPQPGEYFTIVDVTSISTIRKEIWTL